MKARYKALQQAKKQSHTTALCKFPDYLPKEKPTLLTLKKLFLIPFFAFLLSHPLSAQTYRDYATTALIPSTDFPKQRFGTHLVQSENRILVACHGEPYVYSSDSLQAYGGAAYLHENQKDGNWKLQQKLKPNDHRPATGFGGYMALSGDLALVAATKDSTVQRKPRSHNYYGAVYIFQRHASGEWQQVQKLKPKHRIANAKFGMSLAISGTDLIIAAPQEPNGYNRSGVIYVFRQQPDGKWTQSQRLQPPEDQQYRHMGFESLSTNEEVIAAGVIGHSPGPKVQNHFFDAGAVYTFVRQPDGLWAFDRIIMASDRSKGDHFGRKTALSGTTLVVTAIDEEEGEDAPHNRYMNSGAAYVFERNPSGDWIETAKLKPLHPSYQGGFGIGAAVQGDSILIGCIWDSSDRYGKNIKTSTGAAYLFTRNGSSWKCVNKLVAPGRPSRDSYGYGLAIFPNQLLVGAYDDADKKGKVHVYTFREP